MRSRFMRLCSTVLRRQGADNHNRCSLPAGRKGSKRVPNRECRTTCQRVPNYRKSKATGRRDDAVRQHAPAFSQQQSDINGNGWMQVPMPPFVYASMCSGGAAQPGPIVDRCQPVPLTFTDRFSRFALSRSPIRVRSLKSCGNVATPICRRRNKASRWQLPLHSVFGLRND